MTDRKTRKLTFILLREPHQRAIQFKINPYVFTIFPLMILAAGLLSYTLFQMYKDQTRFTEALELQIVESDRTFSQTIHMKDKTIEQLQIDLVSLSNQAEEVQLRLDELAELEDNLKSITLSELPDEYQSESEVSMIRKATPSVTIASPYELTAMISAENPRHPLDIGGISYPIDLEGMASLAAQTSRQFLATMQNAENLDTQLRSIIELIQDYQEWLQVTPNIWPADSKRITSHYGQRIDPFTRRSSFHSGIDFGGQTGDPIYATANGVVTTSAYDPFKGNYIKINHRNGIQTQYMHLHKRAVVSGDTVTKGQIIGTLGNTGRSKGSHLHYEILKDGKFVNPIAYLPID